tara:strand:- start:1236 stop:1526 length:291 start_codon:yes stop_codon:yes gene_type:complete
MTYKEFLETLEELQLDLDSAAEALDLEILDIEAWEEEDEIPKSAEKWVKKEKVEFAELHNSNEEEDLDDEEEDENNLDDDNDDEDLNFDDKDEDEK